MTISTVNDIASALAASLLSSGGPISFAKYITSITANGLQSLWTGAGFPGAGATPPAYNAGAGYTCDRTTPGALRYTNGSTKNWLARGSLYGPHTNPAGGAVILADRLWACSGIGFGAATYTITTPGSLPARVTNSGADCELWVENYGSIGAINAITANFLDSAGASKSKATPTNEPFWSATAAETAPLLLTDTGISQLTSIVLPGSITSGTLGVTIMRRIATVHFDTESGTLLNWAKCLTPVPNDACLYLIYGGVAFGFVTGSFVFIDK